MMVKFLDLFQCEDASSQSLLGREAFKGRGWEILDFYMGMGMGMKKPVTKRLVEGMGVEIVVGGKVMDQLSLD